MEKHSSHRVGGLSRRNRGDLCRRSFSEQDFGYGQRRHDDCDTLRIWGHYNKDRLNYDDSNYAMTTSLRWHNLLGGVQWSGRNVAVGIGYSAMTDRLSLLMPPLSVMVPSGHSVATASGSYGFSEGRCDRFRTGRCQQRGLPVACLVDQDSSVGRFRPF